MASPPLLSNLVFGTDPPAPNPPSAVSYGRRGRARRCGVMLVTEKPLQGEFSLTGPDGRVAATSRERHGSPPYFWFTEIKAPAAGSWRATLTPQQAGAGCGPITREIKVRPDKPGGPGSTAGSTWRAHRRRSRLRLRSGPGPRRHSAN